MAYAACYPLNTFIQNKKTVEKLTHIRVSGSKRVNVDPGNS